MNYMFSGKEYDQFSINDLIQAADSILNFFLGHSVYMYIYV